MAVSRRVYSICCGFGLVLLSCVKDKPEPKKAVLSDPEPLKRVFVVNEGNFTSGNASISLYNSANNEVQEDYFKTINNTSLGDVAQSMAYINEHYYLVVNNSGKIVVCDKAFKMKTNITGLVSPRYILQVSATKAYVSDYKSGYVSVLDLSNHTVSRTIGLPGWTEEMVLLQNKVYVCNVSKDYLYVINPVSDEVEDSVWVGIHTSGIQLDKNGKLWVLSSGDFVSSAAQLSLINPNTLDVEKSFVFPAIRQPFKLAMNGRRDSLYFMDKDIFVMPVSAVSLPDVALIKAGSGTFYGLGIHPLSSEVYLSDALDYVQRSHISVYAANGTKKAEFKAGINANGFYFE